MPSWTLFKELYVLSRINWPSSQISYDWLLNNSTIEEKKVWHELVLRAKPKYRFVGLTTNTICVLCQYFFGKSVSTKVTLQEF
jgi:hypothetical protein